jgi:salicylate hydroxylase
MTLTDGVGCSAAKDVGLWQIRDLPMLQIWTTGRAILIGDAAHASECTTYVTIQHYIAHCLHLVLPHHGAGATSAIEDAEAVAFALRNATAASESVLKALAHVVQVRYKRATAFQVASRAQGLHAELDLQDGEKILEAWAYPGAEVWEQGRPEMILDV